MPRVADSSFSEIHIGEQEQEEPVGVDSQKPFRILMAGDFSGRTWRENAGQSFTPRRVDRDNFDDVLAAMRVTLNLHGIEMAFRELEDFHPDRIYQSVPLFQNLDQYLNEPEAPRTAAAAPPRPAASGSLLDQMVDEIDPVAEAPVSIEDANDLASFIKRVTKGHLEAKPDPAKQQRAAKRTALATELLQGILHHPRLQAIEAAWRAVFFLIRELDTDHDLQLYLLDISLPELVGNLPAIQKELRQKAPWGLLVGNFSFGQAEVDAQVLERMATLSSSLSAPFVAEGRLPGESGPSQAWNHFRHSDGARWIGLVLPRFLLRLPYGKATDTVESFPFEEMPQSEHGSYLWGNPAFLCAYLIGQSFLDRGWDLTHIQRRVDGLPLHVYREDDEPVAKPCAEVLMTEKEAMSLLDEGFMPLASIKHEPAAMIVRFQSIADPVAPLAGLH